MDKDAGMDKVADKGYSSIEEYWKELSDWGKRWIQLYCRYAVDTSEQGEISLIKGKLLFKRELSSLCEQSFSAEEIQRYAAETDQLKQDMNEIHRKSRMYIAYGEMVVMEYLYRMFGFDEFEWYLFCMAFLLETDNQFERVYALLQDDFSKKAPTLKLCIQMYTLEEEKQYELLHRIVERWDFFRQFLDGVAGAQMGKSGESILSTELRLDERMVRFVYDMNSRDTVLGAAVECYLPTDAIEPMLIRQELLDTLKRMYTRAGKNGFLYISGQRGGGKKFLVRHFCRYLNCSLLMVNTERLLDISDSPEQLIRRLAREAVLKGGAVVCLTDVLEEDMEQEDEGQEEQKRLEQLAACFQDIPITPIFTSERPWVEAARTGERQCMELVLEPADREERRILWDAYLKKDGLLEEIDTERLADTYRLPPGAIGKVVRETKTRLLTGETFQDVERLLYQGCQRQLVHRLGKDAVQISTQYTMEELVLPASQKKLLSDACDMVKYRHQVFESWGFNRKMAYGKGVSMIFYGPPGTGKTMGAQALANALHLELYRVDMASVLSKYVGDSEKKLGNIFEQGQKSQSILFFDEADALFGKRSEVKDSQDKYANASTAFLLQKLEDYQGIIILATNLLQNFDQAFCRRFQFMIEFPFPDIQRREEIWKKVFPEELPKEELDYGYLAEQFVLSGSQIKNIAVGAAFLAAGAQEKLGMLHVLLSVKREMKKNGKNMIAGDFGIYYSLMEQTEGE